MIFKIVINQMFIQDLADALIDLAKIFFGGVFIGAIMNSENNTMLIIIGAVGAFILFCVGFILRAFARNISKKKGG